MPTDNRPYHHGNVYIYRLNMKLKALKFESLFNSYFDNSWTEECACDRLQQTVMESESVQYLATGNIIGISITVTVL